MKSSKRNIKRQIAKAEKRAVGPPKVSKYYAKSHPIRKSDDAQASPQH